ncbi:Protein FAM13A [Collichthys lucidus]|uniref:Protein FAM13A n=2 Tax=Sciaenidae TaxID=30870 RepID=A0A4U5U2L1_COLLU|nr:Protein FAM13A [Collichthys lucidus]
MSVPILSKQLAPYRVNPKHNKTAVQVKEDMKKMVQIPMLRPRTVKHTKLFGVSLFELQEKGLVENGVPVVLRRMVEHLRKHALDQEGLFRVNGNVRAVETLKQRLESGEDVDLLSESDLCTVASLLKRYLRDLPEGLVDSAVQQALIHHYQECGDDVSWSDMRDLLQQLPDVHHSLLRYLCHFLTLVECNHKENRMTAFNLATVFGPSVFHVAPGFEAIKDQNICNKIMVKLIQNYSSIFEAGRDREDSTEELSTLIIVKEAQMSDADTKKSPSHPSAKTPTPVPRTKLRSPSPEAMETAPIPLDRQDTSDTASQLSHLDVSPSGSVGGPQQVHDSHLHTVTPLLSLLLSVYPMGPLPSRAITVNTTVYGSFFRPDVANYLDRTIRSAVEQHLFDPLGDQSSTSEDSQLTPCPPSPSVTPTARQRRRHQREQQEEDQRHRERNRASSIRADTNKENIPSSSASSSSSVGEDTSSSSDTQGGQSGHTERTPKARKSKHSPTLVQLTDNQDASATFRMKIQESPVTCDTGRVGGGGGGGGEVRGSDPDCEKTSCEDVPRLDLTTLTEDNNNWGGIVTVTSAHVLPMPALHKIKFKCDVWSNNRSGVITNAESAEIVLSAALFILHSLTLPSLISNAFFTQVVVMRESMDREEARLSLHAGGRLIRQLLEEDSDPMLSPRFYAFGQCQQYLDDTEVPPSPPNAHSFVRRSSSLGSCDDEKEELTSAQLTKRIHILKKKIHRFEERFEEERKYRPSHSDKVANPEVLRWVNELAKLRKELKEHKLMKSEEDLPPLTRQRSNTLPKSFGSQLEKKPQQEKVAKPPVESTLETIMKKLQEKREEVNRPEDIKDMTREQIGAEKIALQKSLLYYESIHGRPVTKCERQIMKPLYDRYRLVKQILCRASTIPVILLSAERAAKITTLSKRLQTLNPQLMLALVPAVGTRWQPCHRRVIHLSGLSKSGFSSSLNLPVVKELMGGRLSSQDVTSRTAECRKGSETVEGSPSSKRRGPLLQPIIEGETALFFDDIKCLSLDASVVTPQHDVVVFFIGLRLDLFMLLQEEEDGSEDDGESKTQFTVTVRPEISVLGFLDNMDEEADGFISPVDELSPSKNTTDMRLSNLHSATMQELVEQLQEAREDKKRLRKDLKEFEDQFFRQNGRNVQKEDRSPLAAEYNEYKHVKAKLRLLEVLISKRDSTKII